MAYVNKNRITAKEHQVLSLIGYGIDNGSALADHTGRSAQGCHQTAASLIRKGWAAKRREAKVSYRLTASGASRLALCRDYPHLIQGEL